MVLVVGCIASREPCIPEHIVLAIKVRQQVLQVLVLARPLCWVCPVDRSNLSDPDFAPTIKLDSTINLAFELGHTVLVVMEPKVFDQRGITLFDHLSAIAKELIHPSGSAILIPSISATSFAT